MKLTNEMIAAVAATVAEPRTVRRVQEALKGRYGCVGKTRRVMALIRPAAPVARASKDLVEEGPHIDDATLPHRLLEAEERATKAERRAALAEHREIAHQDLRAEEVYKLRQNVAALLRDRPTERETANRHIAVFRDLARARSAIAIYEKALQERGVDPQQLLAVD